MSEPESKACEGCRELNQIRDALRLLAGIVGGNGPACPEHGDTLHYCIHCVVQLKAKADYAKGLESSLGEKDGELASARMQIHDYQEALCEVAMAANRTLKVYEKR